VPYSLTVEVRSDRSKWCSAPTATRSRRYASPPSQSLLTPYLPRDLYPLGAGDDPLHAEGRVEAAQRGMNSGLSLAAGSGGGDAAIAAVRFRFAPPTGGSGGGGNDALTIKPDHSVGADQHTSSKAA
jgi:hypothetical protein